MHVHYITTFNPMTGKETRTNHVYFPGVHTDAESEAKSPTSQARRARDSVLFALPSLLSCALVRIVIQVPIGQILNGYSLLFIIDYRSQS
jgi:glycerol-3-phosphate dehydrogenase